MGRGVRHEKDFCMVYFCDSRYKGKRKNILEALLGEIQIRPYDKDILKSFLKNKGFKTRISQKKHKNLSWKLASSISPNFSNSSKVLHKSSRKTGFQSHYRSHIHFPSDKFCY